MYKLFVWGGGLGNCYEILLVMIKAFLRHCLESVWSLVTSSLVMRSVSKLVQQENIIACSPSWELELRPLGVATGNALSVTRSEDTYVKTPPVGRRQPMTSLPACHNISAAGRIHHQLFRLH